MVIFEPFEWAVYKAGLKREGYYLSEWKIIKIV